MYSYFIYTYLCCLMLLFFLYMVVLLFFFFKQKTAYEMRISDWSSTCALPIYELLFRAQSTHRRHFDPNRVQLSRLLSIKTGGCPEDCKYCPQSSHYDTGLAAEKLLDVDAVLAEAGRAKASGDRKSTRLNSSH